MTKLGPVLLTVLALAACSTNAAPDRESAVKQSANAILSGDADTGDPAVVAIGPRRIDCEDTIAPFCSGVLIAPRVVLTAAHCFAGQRPGDPYEVFIGADVTQPGEEHGVTRVVTPDGYDGGNGGGDLALLVLDGPATPAPVALGALDAGDVGKSVTVAGFGIASDDGGGVGTKRSGAALVSQIGPAEFKITPGPAMSCDGDSGGPIFLHGAGGDTLVGITSYGDPGCTTFAENARVDAYKTSFIDVVIASSADAGTAPDPAAAPPQNVCSGSCTSAAQCGPGFDCPAGPDGAGRCTLNGLPPGDFGRRCTTGADCDSNMCARLGSQPTSCLCLTICQRPAPDADGSVAPIADPPPADSKSGCGCRLPGISRGSSGTDAAAALGFLAVVAALRKRKRSL